MLEGIAPERRARTDGVDEGHHRVLQREVCVLRRDAGGWPREHHGALPAHDAGSHDLQTHAQKAGLSDARGAKGGKFGKRRPL